MSSLITNSTVKTASEFQNSEYIYIYYEYIMRRLVAFPTETGTTDENYTTILIFGYVTKDRK